MFPISFYRVCLTATALAGLSGCANTQWERALYQGALYGTAQCQIKRNPAEAPCAELTDYGSYERERTKAKGGAIEGQQP